MRLSTQSFLVWLMLTMSLTHGAVFTAQQEEDLVSFTESVMQCYGRVGLAIAAVKGNETWTRGFGKADRERDVEASSSHLFGIGSNTKSFAATLLSIVLNDTGRYSWDTPVVDILGEDFKFINDQLTQQVTLKDVLSHRTGLVNSDLPIFAGFNTSRADMAQRLRHLPVDKAFRQEMIYNNLLYTLVSRATEVLGNGSWEDLLHARLLQPLGMSSSGIIGQTVSISNNNFAKPYVNLRGQTVLSDSTMYSLHHLDASGGLASSADDMAKWLLLHVNNGWSQTGGQVLNRTLMRQMATAHIDLPANVQSFYSLTNPPYPVDYSALGYGCGWMTASYRGSPLIWHAGFIFAYTSHQAVLPDQNAGFFVGSNGPYSHQIERLLFYYVADLLMNKEHWLNVTSACHFPSAWAKRSTHERTDAETEFEEPQRYAGYYRHPLFGSVHVTPNGSRGLNIRYGHLEGRLLRGQEDNVTRWEVQGIFEFYFRPGADTPYMPSVTFANASSGNVFQNIQVGFEGDVVEFFRWVTAEESL